MSRGIVRGCVAAGLLISGIAGAQRYYGRESWIPNAASIRTAREVPTHSSDTPNWTNDARFDKDVFTFARIRYGRNPYRYGRWDWTTDLPDSDLNLSFRLQQMTSIKVDPDGRVLNITDEDLSDYPWIYIVEPGGLHFTEEEVVVLREYLLNGGFLMVDDFWCTRQYENFYREIKRVFPDREPKELDMTHQIFHSVFDLRALPKNKLQVPNIRTAVRSQYNGGMTGEVHDGEYAEEVHIQAISDDRDRIMVLICHNTDNGDGWEREGEDDFFFHNFSEKIAFPLGINIVFYAMTH